MNKTIYVYDNDRNSTGVWASEKFIKSYQGGDCEEITVEIPGILAPYVSESGDTMVKLGDYHYPLDECLRVGKNDNLYLKSMEPGQRARGLKVISRNGRISLSLTI